MHITNAEGVHFCLLGGRAIFLDIKRDRYFAASRHASATLERVLNGVSGEEPGEALVSLLGASLLILSENPARQLKATRARAACEDWPETAGANPLLVASALAFQMRTFVLLRYHGFASLVAGNASRPERVRPRRSAAAIIAAHRASNLLFSAHDRCLGKALALHAMLHAAGHEPRLILGVRDYPFGAHAWVELEGMAASDPVDRIAFYQPLMIL